MDLLQIVRWVLGGLLGLAGLYLSVLNWVALVRRFTRERASSWTPLIGGALLVAAALVAPSTPLKSWWWVAFLIDGGSVPGLLSVPIGILMARARERGK